MSDAGRGLPWTVFLSELIGTALLVGVGLSLVILDFGHGSPVLRWLPDAGLRRAITGFLFGSTGALIALSWVGKESGAHINPVVSLAFCLMGKQRPSHAAGYVVAQFTGAVLGALPLLLWGGIGHSVAYGATTPGRGYTFGQAILGETVTTFALVAGLFVFLRHDRFRSFTPALFPFLYAFMVFVEAPVSGTSTNPARTLGPAVVSGAWRGWWVYWVGPLAGALLGVLLFRFTRLREIEVEVAKLYHFGHDPHGIFGVERRAGARRLTQRRGATPVHAETPRTQGSRRWLPLSQAPPYFTEQPYGRDVGTDTGLPAIASVRAWSTSWWAWLRSASRAEGTSSMPPM